MKCTLTTVRWIATAALCAAALAAGCQPAAKDDLPLATRYGKQVPVEASWRQFAMEHYRGMVLAEIRAQPDATFASNPDISASVRNDNGELDLMVVGEMDINDVKGNRIRKPYSVVWRRSGGGWEPLDTIILDGKPSPQPLGVIATTGPVVAPTTRAMTPANPNAMAPPSDRPSSAAPGTGGLPAPGPSGGTGSPSLPPP